MKVFRNLKLRTKLISSFILLALIVAVFVYLAPRFVFKTIIEDTFPTLVTSERIGALIKTAHLEVVEFVTINEEESVEEFKEKVDELSVLSEQLKSSLSADDPSEERRAFEDLIDVSEEITVLGQEIIESHEQTLENFEALKELEQESEEKIEEFKHLVRAEVDEHLAEEEKKESSHNPILVQQYFGEFVQAFDTLQHKVLEFVALGEEKTFKEFGEKVEELETARKKLSQIIGSGELSENEFSESLDDIGQEIQTRGRAVLNSHTRTLSLLEELEEAEEKSERAIARVQELTSEEVSRETVEANRNILIFAGAMLVLALLFGTLLTNGLVRPIRELTEVATQIGAGNLTIQARVDTQDEVGELAHVLNTMASQLQDAFVQAEQRSQKRILELETTAEISRQLTTILDVDQLLQKVVTGIQEAFKYYHVHIYLIDQNTGELVMREGTGEIGRKLKARGHKLQIGHGIVGNVVRSGQSFLADNVDEVSNFVRNPLLTKTQAELAVPIRKGNVFLGVLDMQSEEVGGFSQEDLTLMQSVADQVAVAIDNTRLFREAQAAVIEAEELNRRLNREAWQSIDRKVSSTGYVFTKFGVAPVSSNTQLAGTDETWLPIMTKAVQQKELIHHAGDGNDGDTQEQTICVSIPLILRNEVIGVIGIERVLPPSEAGMGSDIQGEGQKGVGIWSEDELTTIRSVAEQVTLALDAARLARETQRAAWRDRVISESTAKVWATSEVEEVMRAAVVQLGDRLRASEVVIRLGKEDELLQE